MRERVAAPRQMEDDVEPLRGKGGRGKRRGEETGEGKGAGRSLEMRRRESDAVTQSLQKPQCYGVRRGYQ